MENGYKNWNGAAAIIVADCKILMVKEKETMCWSVPSGEIEQGETPEQACIREVWEETGFQAVVTELIYIKTTTIRSYAVTTHYFLCEIAEGQISYKDPDDEIEEVAWKTAEDFVSLQHDYPEDQEMLLSFLNQAPVKYKFH